MEFIMLLLATLLLSTYSIILKFAVERCENTSQQILFNGCLCAAAALLAGFVTLKGGFQLSVAGIAFVCMHGVLFLLTVILNLKAVECGSLSLTTLIVNFSLVLPLFYSFCFLGEAFTVKRIFGIVLLAVCLVIFANPKMEEQTQKKKGKWFALAILAMLCNGLLSVISKAYMVQTDGTYASAYVFWGYTASSLLTFVIYGIMHRKPEQNSIKPKAFFAPVMLLLMALTGAASFGGNYLVTLLATRMDGVIVYPFVQGGSVIVTALISRFCLHERISASKWTAIGIGTLSIVLLNL